MSDKPTTGKGVRLNKYLALALGLSRREVDDMISSQKITIDNRIAKLGERFDPKKKLKVDGKTVNQLPVYCYVMLNKPIGYVCSRRQQDEKPTIYQLLPKKYHSLKPVGRLDANSSGLILLSNDGDFALRMTHPSFNKTKIYEVLLNKPFQPLHQQMISQFGVKLSDGNSQFTVNRMKEGDSLDLEVIMHEGRNRQIRRTFLALGYRVIKLHRKQFGKYQLGDLPEGNWQEIQI